ncbi:transposase [Sporosarcina limicola]|uniref:Transposase n=1 Tax=Sporosarcina limicola TaxID=34101 RepID=A0A927MH47_9BACL|nr:transposase [Sporosarcina limicola]MBE1553057.1 transposase [Sporosarcina limicola]
MGKKYGGEFKMLAVKLVIVTGKPVAQIAVVLDIGNQTLYNWMKKYNEDQNDGSFIDSGHKAPEDKTVQGLQKRIRNLEEENSILKKAMCIFAKKQK